MVRELLVYNNFAGVGKGVIWGVSMGHTILSELGLQQASNRAWVVRGAVHAGRGRTDAMGCVWPVWPVRID